MVSLLLVPVAVFLLLLLKKSLLGAKRLPPGPNAWQLFRNRSEFKERPHAAFAKLAKFYGPIMSLRLGTQVVVVASSAAAAKSLLHTHDRIFSGRYLPSVYYDIPNAPESSISMSKECDDLWKFLRSIGQNFIFSPKSVEQKADMRKEKVMEVMKYLRGKEGEVVKVEDLISATLTNIISNILISKNLLDITGEGKNDARVKEVVNQIVETVSSPGISDLFPFLKIVDFQTKRRGVKLYEKIKSIWGDIVRERRARHDRSAVPARDFLDVLFAESTFTDGQISILFMELIIAGIDSSIVTSVWLMVELIRHPETLLKVRGEIATAFDGDTLVDESVLTDSRSLQACIKETLRFHMPGPFFAPHRAIETCEVDGYIIPKDSVVLVNAWAISMEPKSWKDASVFNHERFLNSNIDYRGTYFELIPFSAGRRMCPGWNVGIKNIQLLVGSLVHFFDWTLPDGTDATKIDTKDKFETVLKKETPLCLIPKLRL